MSDLFIGRVIKVHQRDNSLDIQLVYDGSRLTAVPLMVSVMTTSSGISDMHHPEGNDWDMPGSTTRDIYVVVSKTDGGYIALGYISPQVNQMMFNAVNFKVDRHASDVYSTINDGGDVELAHPSGSFVKIGAGFAAHEDLTGQDCDGLWSISRNTGSAAGLCVQICNAGEIKATLKIHPNGDVELDHKENLKISTEKYIIVNAGKDITINAARDVSVTATRNMDVLSGGRLTVSAQIIELTSDSLTHNGVNVGSTHVHAGVIPGPASTQVPH